MGENKNLIEKVDRANGRPSTHVGVRARPPRYVVTDPVVARRAIKCPTVEGAHWRQRQQIGIRSMRRYRKVKAATDKPVGKGVVVRFNFPEKG